MHMSASQKSENIEGKTAEDKENDVEKESQEDAKIDNDNDIAQDIMANNVMSTSKEEGGEKTSFTKEKVLKDVAFSFWNMDVYLHHKYRHLSLISRGMIEILVVTVLFMLFPVLFAFIQNGFGVLTNPSQTIFGENEVSSCVFFRKYTLLALSYAILAIISMFSDNVLYVSVAILNIFRISSNEYTIELVQIINSTSWYWKQVLICTLIVWFSSIFPWPYAFGKNDGSYEYAILTSLFMYAIFMSVICVERFFMCFLISETRKNEYRGWVWDINYKTFVFKKLTMISESDPDERKKLIETVVPEFDPGFYLKYNDLRLESTESAEMIAESIFEFLEIRVLTYEDIRRFFPENYDEVYVYLSENKVTSDGKNPPVTFDEFKGKVVSLHKERDNILKTLLSRDNVMNKLDIILFSIAAYVGGLLVMILLEVDYKLFLASIGSSTMAFSWVFSDTIKEVYNCFIFLLVSRPYDFGDRVVIDGEELYVSSVDLLSSTFIGVNGRYVFIPTTALFNKKICNVKRSRMQLEVVDVFLQKSTTFDDALELKDRIKVKLKEMNKLFSGEIYLRRFVAAGDCVNISFAIQHQSNFQDIVKLHYRRKELVPLLEREMETLGIGFLNSYAFSD